MWQNCVNAFEFLYLRKCNFMQLRASTRTHTTNETVNSIVCIPVLRDLPRITIRHTRFSAVYHTIYGWNDHTQTLNIWNKRAACVKGDTHSKSKTAMILRSRFFFVTTRVDFFLSIKITFKDKKQQQPVIGKRKQNKREMRKTQNMPKLLKMRSNVVNNL